MLIIIVNIDLLPVRRFTFTVPGWDKWSSHYQFSSLHGNFILQEKKKKTAIGHKKGCCRIRQVWLATLPTPNLQANFHHDWSWCYKDWCTFKIRFGAALKPFTGEYSYFMVNSCRPFSLLFNSLFECGKAQGNHSEKAKGDVNFRRLLTYQKKHN